MKKIPMLDLRAEIDVMRAELNLAVNSVMDSTQFINGPAVREFEKELADYLQVKHVVSCGNGTDALMIALMAAGLKPGDGVLTTPFSFFATAEVIAFLGLEVQFADVLPDTYNIDPKSIEKNIKSNTKAIIPVHLFGQTADMSAIMDIASANGLFVIEDSAQATGGRYRMQGRKMHNGTIGDIGCTSFFPSKNLGCYGDGGAIFTNDDELAEVCRMIKNHGSKIKYTNEIVGVNSRLDALQAAILRVKLRKLDKYNENRRRVAAAYNAAFSENEAIVCPDTREDVEHVWHQYTMKIVDGGRDKLQAHLTEKGIATAIYYNTPLHLQGALRDYAYKKGDYPLAEMLSEQVLSLPMDPYLPDEDLQYIIASVKEFYN